MRAILWLFFIVGFLLVLGLITLEHSRWSVFGLNVPLSLAALVTALKFFYWAGKIGQFPIRLLEKRKAQKRYATLCALREGFELFLQQRDDQMLATLKKAYRDPEYAALAHLLNAQSALRKNDFTTCEQALSLARSAGATPLTVDLLCVEVWYKRGENHQAQALLEQLHTNHPTHPMVQKLRQAHPPTEVAQNDAHPATEQRSL